MPRQRARSQGLALVSDLSEAVFGPFLRQLAKRGRGDVQGVEDLTRQQLQSVCAALHQQTQAALRGACQIGDGQGEDDDHGDDMEDDVLTLHGAALLALELFLKSQQQPPEQLLATAVLLHDDALMSQVDPRLGSMQVDMQDAVMRLCCAWWERRMPGNELLVPRTIPYVLLRAVQSLDRSKASLVHMCYVIRDALMLLDYEDETIKDTKRLLLMAAMHPVFLREPEGRRFIAGLFSLDPQMTRELGAIMRNQIPSGQRFALEAYGEVLFRAWRDTMGPCAAEVESEMQTLMQAAIAASTPALAAALRVVLNGLHSQKNIEKRLNPVLVRLYDPILPRAFGAANGEVRRNALNLLVSAFPIVDPEASASENNGRLTTQLGLLMDCLSDACPAVREAAIDGCCRCLNLFWEIIPAATSAKIIGDITGKLAFDNSSRLVRAAVLRGLRVLVDNQNAHPVLKKALPGISGLLHDSDSKVREEFADLLVGVSACRGLQLWAIVPPEQLLDAVAADLEPAVARKIAHILVPSFFPNAQEGSARVGALLRANPEAGLAFCRQLVARYMPDEHRAGTGATEFTVSVPVEQVVQLAGDLAAHLLATAPGQGPVEQQDVQPPPKRKKPATGATVKDAARKDALAGKKRGKKKPADADGDDDVDCADQAAQAAPVHSDVNGQAKPGDADDDVVLQDAGAETAEGWLAILAGLEVVCEGLAGAVALTECREADVAAALGGDTLEQLLRASEEQVHERKAMELVLQLMVHVSFLPGAQGARSSLFQRLAQGALPGLGSNTRSMHLEGNAPPVAGLADLLPEILKTLATGSNSPKLAAMLAAALGVREPLTIRKPVALQKARKGRERAAHDQPGLEDILATCGADGDGQDDDDDIVCQGCRRAEPSDTMLLCDGCDAACHTHCLCPALPDVPEANWFCCDCETQLQSVELQPAAAARCVCLLLQHDLGRQLLCKYPSFGDMIQAMHQLAITEADDILRLAMASPADEADSAPADSCPAEGCALGSLDDPWGALSRYCRAALHRAMWATMPHASGDEEEEEGAGAIASRTPCKTPLVHGAGRRKARAVDGQDDQEQEDGNRTGTPSSEGAPVSEADGGDATLLGFYEIVPVIDYAVQTCSHLATLIMEQPAACLAAQLAALQYGHGLLRVLHVVHQTDLMNMGDRYVATVAGLCSAQVKLARAAAISLADQGGDTAQQKACVSSTLQAVMGLTKQLAESVRAIAGQSMTPGTGITSEGQPDVEEQGEEQLSPPSHSLGRLAADIVSTCDHPALKVLGMDTAHVSSMGALVKELLPHEEQDIPERARTEA